MWFRSNGRAEYVGSANAVRKGPFAASVGFDAVRRGIESQQPERIRQWFFGPADRSLARTIIVIERTSGMQTIETTRETDAPAGVRSMIATLDGAAARAAWKPIVATAKR